MTARELRAQLRAQPSRNSPATWQPQRRTEVASAAGAMASTPHYRWLILNPDGSAREVAFLPELTAAELASRYPGTRLIPLPDSASEADEFMRRNNLASST
jgi:hypothetical protein